MSASCEIEIKVNASRIKVENILGEMQKYVDAIRRNTDFAKVIDGEIVEESLHKTAIYDFSENISLHKLEEKLTTLNTAIDTTQGKVETYTSAVEANDSAILALENSIVDANDTLAKMTTSMGKLDELIKGTMTYINDHKRIYGPSMQPVYDTYPFILNREEWIGISLRTPIKFPIQSTIRIRRVVIPLYAKPSSMPKIKAFKVNDIDFSASVNCVRTYEDTNHYGFNLKESTAIKPSTPEYELVIDVADAIATYSAITPFATLNVEFAFENQQSTLYDMPPIVQALYTSRGTFEQFYSDIGDASSNIRQITIDDSLIPVAIFGIIA